MSIFDSIRQPICSPICGSVGDGDVYNSTPWLPSVLSGLSQRFLDQIATYYASTLASLPIITPEETGTLAIPRGGRCLLFDGADDYCIAASRLYTGNPAVLTVTAWTKQSTAARIIIAEGMVSASTDGWVIQTAIGDATAIWFFMGSSGAIAKSPTGVLSSSVLHHFAWVYDGSATGNANRIKLYIDGVQQTLTFTGTVPSSIASNTDAMMIGKYSGGSPMAGSIRDVRFYNVAKSAAEIAAIYNQASTPTTIDRTGLLAGYWCEDEAGTTVRDWSGNGKHLTATNVTTATFHATDSGVTYSAANELGHTLSGATVIPRNEANTAQDVAGSALANPGPLKLPATTEVPCVTGDGAAVNVVLGDLSISITSLSMMVKLASDDQVICTLQNSTATSISVVAGVLTFGASLTVSAISVDGSTVSAATAGATLNDNNWHRVVLTLSSISCSNVKLLTNSSTFGSVSVCDVRFVGSTTKTAPLQEGPGTGNTNRTIYIVCSDGTSSTVTNAITSGTVATIWGNRCPYVQDHFLNYGGRVASGVAIPGRLGSGAGTAADGLANTSAIGKRRNPYTAIMPNYWGAPSLANIGYTSSTRLYYGDAVQSISPADTKYRRTASDGDDRYFAVRAALTGSDKTNAQTYAT